MPLRATVAGRSLRSDDLTLGQVLDIETATGKRWDQLNPYISARDALAIVLAMLASARVEQPGSLARSLPADVSRWLAPVEDDLPDAWREGVPTLGGRSFDDYVVVFASEPWCWPPDVTRRQTVRDLDLLIESAKGRNNNRKGRR